MLFISLMLACSSPALAAIDMAAMQGLIPRFRQVSASIYAGGNPTSSSNGEGLNALVNSGFYTMVNLQGGDIDDSFYGWINSFRQKGDFESAIQDERLIWEFAGLQWFNFPLNSHVPVTPEEDAEIREALAIMAQATPEKPLYIHCEHGADRTGLLIALHRVLYLGWSKEDAYAEWVRNGHGRLSRLITGDLDVYFYRAIGELAPLQARASTSSDECALRVSR
jgi:hypothetical protein